MKPLTLIAASILCLSFGMSANAATEVPAKNPPAVEKTDKAKPAGNAMKAMPMHTRVDAIDAKAMTFTHTNQNGSKMTNRITATSVVMQGDRPAKFSDIKIGDYVSGKHLKKSDTEYEIVKISKFGPKAPKTDKKILMKKP